MGAPDHSAQPKNFANLPEAIDAFHNLSDVAEYANFIQGDANFSDWHGSAISASVPKAMILVTNLDAALEAGVQPDDMTIYYDDPRCWRLDEALPED